MITRIKQLAFLATTGLLFAAPAALASVADGADDAKPASAPTKLFGGGSLFSEVSNVLIFLVGAIAVIMLIIGGLRYVTSQGDASAVKSAKDTILYAVAGIVVAVMAYAIVHFVATSLH